MSLAIVRTSRHSRKWPFPALGFATLAILGCTFGVHAQHVNTQNTRGRTPLPVSTLSVSDGSTEDKTLTTENTDAPSVPRLDPAEKRVEAINQLIDQKQQFLDTTNASVSEHLQILAQSQQNIDALTDGVNNDGLNDLGQHIRDTKPLIQKLKRTMEEHRYKIALLMITADNIERRIIQLKMQIVHELQPDPSRLLALKKQRDTQVNTVLREIDVDDPYAIKELQTTAALRSKLEADIQAETALVLNRAAAQGVAAKDLEDCEHDRSLRRQETGLPEQLRDELLNSPKWHGETY